MHNVDRKTVDGFGQEWSRFDQSELSERERSEQFERYFKVFPWNVLPDGAVGFDLGCGSGRWATLAAQRVGRLHCIDASSEALVVAKRNLADAANVEFHAASVDAIPLEDGSMDFGYSLGVLHHIPDTEVALASCVKKLKPGAPFLVYLYYAFDNRPAWFRVVWRVSDVFRRGVAVMPFGLKKLIADLIAATVYLPLARLASILERVGVDVDVIPLSTYRQHSFYTMRTDALDRFGTRLEQRFTRKQIAKMMHGTGLKNVEFSDETPYWCAVGLKKEI